MSIKGCTDSRILRLLIPRVEARRKTCVRERTCIDVGADAGLSESVENLGYELLQGVPDNNACQSHYSYSAFDRFSIYYYPRPFLYRYSEYFNPIYAW